MAWPPGHCLSGSTIIFHLLYLEVVQSCFVRCFEDQVLVYKPAGFSANPSAAWSIQCIVSEGHWLCFATGSTTTGRPDVEWNDVIPCIAGKCTQDKKGKKQQVTFWHGETEAQKENKDTRVSFKGKSDSEVFATCVQGTSRSQARCRCKVIM